MNIEQCRFSPSESRCCRYLRQQTNRETKMLVICEYDVERKNNLRSCCQYRIAFECVWGNLSVRPFLGKVEQKNILYSIFGGQGTTQEGTVADVAVSKPFLLVHGEVMLWCYTLSWPEDGQEDHLLALCPGAPLACPHTCMPGQPTRGHCCRCGCVSTFTFGPWGDNAVVLRASMATG